MTPRPARPLPLAALLVMASLVALAPRAMAQDAARGGAPAGDRSPHSDAALVSDAPAVRPGAPFEIALRLTMDEGWHSYWINAGDSGLATKITWALPNGFTAGPIRWPYPHRIDVPPLTSYGYEDEVLLLTTITPPADLPPGPVEITGKAEWLICADVCLPAEADVALTLPVGDGPPQASDVARAMADARAALPAVVPAWRVGAARSDGGYALRLAPPAGWTGALDGAQFFPTDEAVIEYAPAQPVTRDGDGFRLDLVGSAFASAPADSLRGVLVAPEGATWDGRARAMAVAVPVEGAVASAAAGPGGADAAGLSLLVALGFALVGGLILNLMPCVFPILSIKILGFAEGRGHDRATMLRHGLAFGAGVLVSFWVLAGALLALRAGGAELGWGFQLQSPWAVGALALLMVGLGLSLVGVFEVGLGVASQSARLDRRQGLGGAFLSGVLATVVATPCTAPFMGAALGWALAQPAAAALAVFTALGAGMALPYVLLSAFPAWLERLPRPGPWMETLKQALAFPLFLTAVWLVWVFGLQTGMDGVALLLVAMTLLGLAAWTVGRWTRHAAPRPRYLAARVAAALALGGAVLALGAGAGRAAPEAAATAATETAWAPYDPAAVEALVAEGRPVFVDFTAAWCLSCQVNKRVALRTGAVEEAFRSRGVALVEADWTRRDPAITAALASFGRSGVPLYVLYPGGGAPPVLLPEVLTPQLVLDALDAVPPAVAAR